jgi:hypothetical protein
VGQRHAGPRQQRGDADRVQPATGKARMDADVKRCIYPGCERPAVPPHPLGGPQPAFCDLEQHNALTAHQERRRLALREEEGDDGR